jgi:hypothetical protein
MSHHIVKIITILAIALCVLTPLLSVAPSNARLFHDPDGVYRGVFVTPIGGSPGCDMSRMVDPSEIGNTITVELHIAGAIPIQGWVLEHFSWNPSVIQFVSVAEGDFLRGGPPHESEYETVFASGTVSSENPGLLVGGLAATIVGDNLQDAHDGILATLMFRVVGIGYADIDIDTYHSQPEQNLRLVNPLFIVDIMDHHVTYCERSFDLTVYLSHDFIDKTDGQNILITGNLEYEETIGFENYVPYGYDDFIEHQSGYGIF